MSAVMLLVAYSFSFSLNSFSVITAPGFAAPLEYDAFVQVITQSTHDRHHLAKARLFSSGACMDNRAARADRGADVGIHERDSAQRCQVGLAVPCCAAIRRAQSDPTHRRPIVGVGEGDAP